MASGSLPVLLAYLLLASLVVGSVAIASATHGLAKEPGEGGIPWAITEDLPFLQAFAPLEPAPLEEEYVEDEWYGEECGVPLGPAPYF